MYMYMCMYIHICIYIYIYICVCNGARTDLSVLGSSRVVVRCIVGGVVDVGAIPSQRLRHNEYRAGVAGHEKEQRDGMPTLSCFCRETRQ